MRIAAPFLRALPDCLRDSPTLDAMQGRHVDALKAVSK
jgi:hypothetical protein